MPMPRMKRNRMSHQMLGEKAQAIAPAARTKHFDTVNPLTADHVRDSTKKQRTNRCSKRSSRFNQALFHLTDMPHGFQQRHDDADDEEIVGVGEEAHS